MISTITAIFIGIHANIYRVIGVFSSYELELYSKGIAATVINIAATAPIPLSAFYAYLMFGQVMSLWAIVGACIIIAAVIFNVLVKAMNGGSH